MKLSELITRYGANFSHTELIHLIPKIDANGATADEAISLWNAVVRVETAQPGEHSVINAHRNQVVNIS